MFKSTAFAFLMGVAALCAPLAHGHPNGGTPPIAKPPRLTPFIHMDLVQDFPNNFTTLFGPQTRVPNRGGTFNGKIEGIVEPIGASNEILLPGTNNAISYYTNQYLLNTTDHEILLMDVDVTIQYANNALHGFSTRVLFSTGENDYKNINFDSYVAEANADFSSGKSSVDVYIITRTGDE